MKFLFFRKKQIKYVLLMLIWVLVFINASAMSCFSKIEKTPPAPEYPFFRFEPYNDPSGTQNLNLFNIEKSRQIVSQAVISPDKTKAAYCETDFYPQTKQTASRLFYINIPIPQPSEISGELVSETPDMYKIKTLENPGIKILEAGRGYLAKELFETLTIVDWSQDGKKLLVKETTGEHQRGIHKTDLWVYDFDSQKAKKLLELRKAIIYYWSKKHNFRIDEFRWDITPLGWALNDNNLIIANFYGYNDKGKQFMGAFGIAADGKTSRILSPDNENLPVSKNGLVVIIEGEKHYYQPPPSK
jgi:hypothetical protein